MKHSSQNSRNRGRSTLLPLFLTLPPSFCMHAIAWVTAANDWASPTTQVKVERTSVRVSVSCPTTACVPIESLRTAPGFDCIVLLNACASPEPFTIG